MHIRFSILHKAIVSAGLNEQQEFLSELRVYLIFNFGLLDCQIEHELFLFIVELVLERVAQNL